MGVLSKPLKHRYTMIGRVESVTGEIDALATARLSSDVTNSSNIPENSPY